MRRALGAMVLSASGAWAQGDALSRGMDAETAGRWPAAIAAYRELLAAGQALPALLGLERVYVNLGWTDSILPVVDSVIRAEPRLVVARSVQLRALRGSGRDAEARAAFAVWTRDVPRDAAPYREYARILLDAGRVAAADTVLRAAEAALGGDRDLAVEAAQLRAALAQWEGAAARWRVAVRAQPWMDQAAVFSLRQAPPGHRAAIRDTLTRLPVERPARVVLSYLELAWGDGRAGWQALAPLPADDSTAQVWTAFADEALRDAQPLAARDALVALLDRRFTAPVAVRAATAALDGGDAASALAISTRALPKVPREVAARQLVPVQVRALAALGRPADAERTAAGWGPQVDEATRAGLARTVAWGWVRRGDVARARAALAGAGVVAADDDEVGGWLALYEGDLATARRGLRFNATGSGDAIGALTFLSRTRAARAPAAGVAFLTLARGDSTAAAAAFAAAADTLPDAAPVLRLVAARLHAAQGRGGDAVALWEAIARDAPNSPEAPEATLERARWHRRAGDAAAARAALETLILSWPGSALVPQARRELDLLRGVAPPSRPPNV
jgi:tetratricopeptide (TPR) repeat protein